METALTFEDLVARLKGHTPLPASGSLSYNLPLTHKQLEELVPLLQDHEKLRGLKLRGCRLDNDAMVLISRAVAFNMALRALDLRDNEIGGSGAAYLANALRNHNHTLLSLDLTGNPALVEDPQVVQEIAMFIHRNSQYKNTPPASPKALVRFQEVPPDTPAGRQGLSFSDAQLERRFQELENSQKEGQQKLATMEGHSAELAELRTMLDVASQQMALVLEMLKKDLEALKAQVSEMQQGETMPSATVAKLEQQCSEMKQAIARLQERVESGKQQKDMHQEMSLVLDAVQLMDTKVTRLETAASAKAQQQSGVQELKQQVALATVAANKAGGEAEAVAASMKAVSTSIKALQAEVAANTASFAAAQKQAAGATEAVGALEEQMRTLQLNMEAMEQALDGADVGQQLLELQARVAALAVENSATSAVTGHQFEQMAASLQTVEKHHGEVAAQVHALASAQLPDRTAQLEEGMAKLQAATREQAAAASKLAPASALEKLQCRADSALQQAVVQLSVTQTQHAAAVAEQLAALPAPYDDSAVQGRVAAVEAAVQQAHEAVAVLKTNDLGQLRSEVGAQLQELAQQQAAATQQATAAAKAELAALRQGTLSRHTALEAAVEEQHAQMAAVEEQHAQMAECLAEVKAALAAVPVFDGEPLRVEVAALNAAQAEVQQAISLLAPLDQAQQLRREAEAHQEALTERLEGISAGLASLKAEQAAAEGRLATAEVVEQVRKATDAQLAELAGQVAANKKAAAADQLALAAKAEGLRLTAQQAAMAVEEVRSDSSSQLAALQEQVAAVQHEAEQGRAELEGRLAAAESEACLAAQRLTDLESGLQKELASSAPSAELAGLRQQCEQLRLGAQQQGATVTRELRMLRTELEQHRMAVLGQCVELQEGLEAIPVYEHRLAALEAEVGKAADQLAGTATAAELQATATQLRGNIEAQHAALAEQMAAIKAVAELQQQQLAGLQAGVERAAEQLGQMATAVGLQQVQETADARQAEVAEELAELGAALKAVKLAAAAQREQLDALEAAAQKLAPAEAVCKLQATVEAQQVAVAKQLGELLSSLKVATDAHQEQLAKVQVGLVHAQNGTAAVQEWLTALQHSVQQAQQQAAQGITSAAAAVLCQEAVRPLEERLAVMQRQQGEQAASSGEAVERLQQEVQGLQGALSSFRQEHSMLASTVGEMKGSALAIAAAVSEHSVDLLQAEQPNGASHRAPSPVPTLQLGVLHAGDAPAGARIASFPLTERTLFRDCESDSEEESYFDAPDAVAPLPAEFVNSRLAAQARQYLQLESVVHRQEQRIHQLEAELLCLKRLLAGGSPLVAGRLGGVAMTPASQRFYDADSVLGDPSPATAGRARWLAATPTAGSAARGTATYSKPATSPAANASVPLGSLESQFHSAAAAPRSSSAGFGGDITNRGAAQHNGATAGNGVAAAKKPAVAPAVLPGAKPAFDGAAC